MNEQPNKVMPLGEALNYLHQHNNVMLHYDNRVQVGIWAPQSTVPAQLKKAVRTYRQPLEKLMKAGDHRVCANRQLHAPYYRYNGNGVYICSKCVELEPYMKGA